MYDTPPRGLLRARGQPTLRNLTPLQPRDLTPLQPRDLCLKNTNQDISHRLKASFPQGIEDFRIVSHERRQELSSYVYLQAPELLWMFCSLG